MKKIKGWEKLTPKDIEALPRREGFRGVMPTGDDNCELHNYLLFYPTGTEHGSGYMVFGIAGVQVKNGCEYAELLGYSDDMGMYFSSTLKSEFPNDTHKFIDDYRMDCNMHGVFRIWTQANAFKVGDVTSSTFVQIVKSPSRLKPKEKRK